MRLSGSFASLLRDLQSFRMQVPIDVESNETLRAELRRRLSSKSRVKQSIADGRKYCAVLIPIVMRDCEPHFIFTVRCESIAAFTDEVCFPGGFVEQTDEAVVDTATRECFEEIALRRDNLEVLYVEGPYRIKRRGKPALLYVVCALVQNAFVATLNPSEVKDIFTAPMKDFVAPSAYRPGEGMEDNCVLCSGILNNCVYVVWGLSLLLSRRIANFYACKSSADDLNGNTLNWPAVSKL